MRWIGYDSAMAKAHRCAIEERNMRTTLIGCIFANLGCIAGCGALLLFYPRNSGFTVTTSRSTHYLEGGVFLSGTLLCLLDLGIGVYLAWSLLRIR